ncbi:MAG: hypothetical protein ACTSVB_00350 [Candidatus Heimdallarchaeaceae archaeon]
MDEEKFKKSYAAGFSPCNNSNDGRFFIHVGKDSRLRLTARQLK